jgi:hypothetical protein
VTGTATLKAVQRLAETLVSSRSAPVAQLVGENSRKGNLRTLARYAKRGILFSFDSGSFEADGINELFEIV